jgi:hypothetical protein
LVAWLDKYCESEEKPSVNCEYARETLVNLETEIIDCLERNNKVVNNEVLRSK